MTPRWRVLIIDDHAPSRAALAETVAAQGGQVVGNGSHVEDALRLVERYRPDVAVLGFLAKPLRQEELGPALDLAVCRFRDLEAVRRENQELKRKLESRKLVDRAKALLIQRLGLTEPEAHRRLQKTAMDTRRPIADVARAVLIK